MHRTNSKYNIPIYKQMTTNNSNNHLAIIGQQRYLKISVK